MSDYQVMPPLSDDDFAALKADIDARGVLVPVEYDEQGNIIDGHHRVRACQELGLTEWPRFVRKGLTDDEKRLHARQLNLARRHLNRDQKRDLIAAQLRDTPERSNRQVAEGLGVDHKTVQSVRAEQERRGEIPHVETTTDTLGRQQPARKPIRTAYVDPTPEGKDEAIARAKDVRAEKTADRKRQLADVDARSIAAPDGLYDVLVIDPPWPMEKIERDVRPNQVAFDYPTMREDDLADLRLPAAENCHVWLWTTQKFMPMAFRLLNVWGLRYVCAFVWHKPGGFQPIGLPQYNCEFALWWLLDLNAFRAGLIRQATNGARIMCGDKPNGDGTYFKWFDLRSFPDHPPLVLASGGSHLRAAAPEGRLRERAEAAGGAPEVVE